MLFQRKSSRPCVVCGEAREVPHILWSESLIVKEKSEPFVVMVIPYELSGLNIQ